ncbi:Conserved oligomeric Golgi complex subunit [Lithohypha guttulata]|uniref:Conserved oligomeric Golgi complex subunit 5 n=1 Tax=Lithohypha guttulata TaxID=1690604 RepID=A0AAN7SMQ7_9EURO|nr:Conserved oligomeric Golgi complex subunit [Lithohypha guttulata]
MTATLPSTLSTYISIEKLTDPSFNPYTYANNLVKSVNTSSATGQPTTGPDSLVDLTTPLQKSLFDLQEIDTSIHALTSRSALDIIEYTQTQNATAQRILERVEEERSRLVSDFERLRTEVLGKYERAEKARIGAERSLVLVKLTKNVQKIVNLARQFESIVTEGGLGTGKEQHKELVRASNTLLEFKDFMSRPGTDSPELGKINMVRQVRGRVFEDGEARLLDWARRVVREFSASSLISTSMPTSALGPVASTYKEAEEARARFTSAVHVLYLLSPAPRLEGGRKMKREEFEAEYLLRALQGYLQSSVTSSVGGISKGLAQLPLLDKALLEEKTSGKTRKAQSKEMDDESDLYDGLDELELVDEDDAVGEQTRTATLLDSLLSSLDTPALASYFWRSLASSLTTKVQEIMNRGGVSARTLKSNKEVVRTELRECVLRGSKMPSALMDGHVGGGKEEVVGNWEREAAVMVGSVMGPLNR